MNIKRFLEERGIQFRVYPHAESFDAAHTAAALHVPGSNLVKTVLLRADGGFRYFVVVLPASSHVDLKRVSNALNHADVQLATEEEIVERCPDCVCGILPPFGSQFAVETIVDASLAEHGDLFFCGDSHSECIRLSYHDFYALEHPLVVPVGVKSDPSATNCGVT